MESLHSGLSIQKIYISQNRRGEKIEKIKQLCREKGVPFQIVPQRFIDRKTEGKNQGLFGLTSPIGFFSLRDILDSIRTGIILILDHLTDTGNFGAIIRTAVAARVDAIIIPSRRSAPINETVLKTSAGSLVHARIVQSKNLVTDIQDLKKDEFWVVGADARASLPYTGFDFKGKTALIVGNEEKGISSLLKKKSDQLISIPHSSQVESLNVSVSTAIILFEALRQKMIGRSGSGTDG
jgi:23S rRNA (guanosine2251-2'-O)-methyltransferase